MLEHRTTTSLSGDIQKKTSVPAETDKIALWVWKLAISFEKLLTKCSLFAKWTQGIWGVNALAHYM